MVISGIPSKCYEQYGETIESWYIQNYGGKIRAREDAKTARKVILELTSDKITKPELVATVFYNLMNRYGASTYGAATCRGWVANTLESFMSRCAEGTTEDYECYTDTQCWEKKGNKNWRCRDNKCVPYDYVEYTPDDGYIWPDLPEIPSLPKIPGVGGNIKKSLQVSALVLIGVVLLIIYMLTGKGERGI